MPTVTEPYYSITGHALLSAAAAAMAAEMLAAVTVASEHIHDLRETSYSGEDEAKAKLINVYQVNQWLASGVTVQSNVASVGRGARSVSYVVQTNGRPLTQDQRAAELREKLDAWPCLRSKR